MKDEYLFAYGSLIWNPILEYYDRIYQRDPELAACHSNRTPAASLVGYWSNYRVVPVRNADRATDERAIEHSYRFNHSE